MRFLILIRIPHGPTLDFLCDLEQNFGPFFASVSPHINDHVGLSESSSGTDDTWINKTALNIRTESTQLPEHPRTTKEVSLH